MTFRSLLEALDISYVETLPDFGFFCANLSAYIDYNLDDDIDGLRKDLLSISDVLETKSVWRLMYIKDEKSILSSLKSRKIISSSTVKLKGSMLEDMQDTINQYGSKDPEKKLAYVKMKAHGLDVNKFSKLFKGKMKELKAKYNDGHIDNVGALYDTFKEKSKQKEFLILDISKVEAVELI